MNLSAKHCIACKKGTSPATAEQVKEWLSQVPGWTVIQDGKWLFKKYKFKNFVESLAFVNKVGEIAEAEQHHPDIKLGWGYVDIYLQTHAAGGLHENDFILAAKIEKLS